MPAAPLNLYDFTREQLREQFVRWELPPIHVARLWNYLYLGLAESFSAAAMPDLPPKVRARLIAETRLGVLPTALETDSSDGFTRKYLLRLDDAERIETVLMRFTGRVTACVSSQVGCAMGCVFCATGQMGYTRHLTPGEIVAQAVHVARALRLPPPPAPAPEKCHVIRDTAAKSPLTNCHVLRDKSSGARLRNIVLMGMGEPLHNYDAVMHAIDILRDEAGLALGAGRITLSTVGVVPGILRLAQEKRLLHLELPLVVGRGHRVLDLQFGVQAQALGEVVADVKYQPPQVDDGVAIGR